MKSPRLLAIHAWAATALPVLANGFYVPVQAPEATARGNAWLATANTAAAVYYNAAGLAQLDEAEVVVGAYGIRLGIEAESAAGDYDNDATWTVLPQIYGAVPINDKLVAGFGLNTPFGLATDWGGATQFRQLAITTELEYLTGWLVAAYQLTDTLSFGGGLGIHHADMSLRRGLSPMPATDFLEFNGDGQAVSWTISAFYKPCDLHSFGLVYRSKSDFSLDGQSRISVLPGTLSASMDLITPATLAAGYAFQPNQDWSFEVNIEWVNWEELDTLVLSQAGLPNSPVPFNWDSNFIYSIGCTRFLADGWHISAGYNFIENSQPDATFNPGVSDADRHWINIGFGRRTKTLDFNFAYQYAFSNRDVHGSPGGLADGRFKSRFNGLMLDLGWRF